LAVVLASAGAASAGAGCLLARWLSFERSAAAIVDLIVKTSTLLQLFGSLIMTPARLNANRSSKRSAAATRSPQRGQSDGDEQEATHCQ